MDRVARPLRLTGVGLLALMCAPPTRADVPTTTSVPDPTADELCGSRRTPPGYEIVIGWADGADATAMELAQDRAEDRAVARYGAGFSQRQRDALRARLKTWSMEAGSLAEVKLAWLGDRKVSCAAVYVPTEAVKEIQREKVAFDADIGALARRVGEYANGLTVVVEPPVWEGGCHPELGPELSALFVAHFADAGISEPLPGEPSPDAIGAQLSLQRVGTDVTVIAQYQDHQAGRQLSIGTVGADKHVVRIPLDLFGVRVDEPLECWGDAQLQGHTTRVAQVPPVLVRSPQIAKAGGVVCEGLPTTVELIATQAAQVRLYSVNRAGTARLLYPTDPTDAPTLSAGDHTSFDLAFVPPEGGGDERLVAVAVPPGKGFGSLAPTTRVSENCRLGTTLTLDAAPSGAWMDTLTLRTVPAGTSGCPAVAPSATAPVTQMPICPG